MILSMRLDHGGFIPEAINLDSNPAHCETHFEKLIDWTKTQITYLFDRGYRCIETLVKIHRSGNFFITRWNKTVSFTVVKNLLFCSERKGDLKITGDQLIRLGKGKKKAGTVFRLITAIFYVEGEPKEFHLLTNRFDLDPFDVAQIYRYRWEIESFFKWLKSCLKINHFITYSENGVYAQIYITLILNLLLAIYHYYHQLACRFGINTQRALMNDLFNATLHLGMLLGVEYRKTNCWTEDLPPPPKLKTLSINHLVTYEIIKS